MQTFNFNLTPVGAMGPNTEGGSDGIGGGGEISVLGKWDSTIVEGVENPGIQIALRCTAYPDGMNLSDLMPHWLMYKGEPVTKSASWVSPSMDPRSGDLPNGWNWYIRADVDIWGPWGFLPSNPAATCEFEVDLLVKGDLRETLPLKGVATFAHPFTLLCGNDLPHLVCPGMTAVISGGCEIVSRKGPSPAPWPHPVGMRLGIPAANQSYLSFSPTGSQSSVDIVFPADRSGWSNPNMGMYRQAIHVPSPGSIPPGSWESCRITAQGTLPDQPLWPPTDLDDYRVSPPEEIVVFNAPDALMDGTPNAWAGSVGQGFKGIFGEFTKAFRLVVPGFRKITITASQVTDAAAGLAWCVYNGANDTQNQSNSRPGDGDEQVYRRWESATDAAPVSSVVKAGVYLLLVGVRDSSASAKPDQEFSGTIAVSLQETAAPAPFNGTSASGTIISTTDSTANHPWGQGLQYQWNPESNLTCDLTMTAAFATRLILTDVNGTVLGDVGGSSSSPARLQGVQLLKGGTYFIEAGRAWNVAPSALGTGEFTLANS